MENGDYEYWAEGTSLVAVLLSGRQLDCGYRRAPSYPVNANVFYMPTESDVPAVVNVTNKEAFGTTRKVEGPQEKQNLETRHNDQCCYGVSHSFLATLTILDGIGHRLNSLTNQEEVNTPNSGVFRISGSISLGLA